VKSNVNRCLLIVVAATVMLAGTAGSALAAIPTQTHTASYVTATTALLQGTIDTGGQPTFWQFQYGPSSRYGSTTMARTIPAGRGTVQVSLRITGLRPGARYHFQLVTQYGAGSTYNPIFVNFGGGRSLRTRSSGNIGLESTILDVRTRYVPVSLYCAGPAPCRAALQISRVSPGHAAKILTLAKRPIVLGGGHTHTFYAKLSNAALALLKRKGNSLAGSLTVTPKSGRDRLTASVALIRT
jgi:hypothetical protein